jgi:hypothetical protein
MVYELRKVGTRLWLVRALSRYIIHALAPKHGLDAVSQIAIDEDWSVLRSGSNEPASRASPRAVAPAEKPLRPKSIFANKINPICPVQSWRKKYSASVVGQISGLNPRVSPE